MYTNSLMFLSYTLNIVYVWGHMLNITFDVCAIKDEYKDNYAYVVIWFEGNLWLNMQPINTSIP